jgi:predicted O-methyltransferase YrrM
MLPNWFESQAHFFERNVPQGPLRVLQIGAYTGDATQWLLDNRQVELLHDIDTWEGSDENTHHLMDFSEVEKVYQSRFGTNDIITSFKMTSDEYFSEWEYSFNFIYIDGDHTAVQTALDGLNAFRLLEPGGVMAFDDYWWNDNPSEFLRPKRGIDAVLTVCEGQYKVIDSGYQMWIQKC